LCAVAQAAASDPLVDARASFEMWKVLYGKSYLSEQEHNAAFNNFLASIERVAAQNEESARSGDPKAATFKLGKFADLSPQQFQARYLTLRPNQMPVAEPGHIIHKGDIPESRASGVDWRDRGVVTDVKDQGQCGSCWAFSITETTESAIAIQRNTTVPVLAPEQLVDCDKSDWGCDGGITEYAWKYLVKTGGMMKESDYPYTAGKTGRAGACKFSSSKMVAPVKNYTWVGTPCQYVGDSCDDQDDTLVQDALTASGPLSICVNANWQDYSSGVFHGSCAHDAGHMNHAVQLVGWNGDENYWIVRNSWNTDWGVDGYIFIKIGGNLCGVANIVSFPGTV